MPSSVSISIKDNQGNTLDTFTYDVKPNFSLDKYIYNLSPSNPKATLEIKTNSVVNVGQRNGKQQWIQSNFIEKNSQQNIKIDMSSHETDTTWWL